MTAKPEATLKPGHGQAVVSVTDVMKAYRRGEVVVEALRGVSLTVHPGQFVAIMGPSGSGKSTLLRCAAGLEFPTTGRADLLGRDLGAMNDTTRTILRRSHAAFVFQDYTLLPTLDVWHNVVVPFTLARRRPPAGRIAEVLDAVGLEDRQKHLPHQLSGGQQQRVAIARALAADADVIFADEPTGALDTGTARTVLGELRATVDRSRSVLMVTHDPVVAAYADEVLFLVDGRVSTRLANPEAGEVAATISRLTSQAAE